MKGILKKAMAAALVAVMVLSMSSLEITAL